jgi:hypothetical protein
MSGGETSLSGTDNNSLALKYTPGYESVFINGVLQVRGSDYVATTGTTVTGLTALTASDVVMVESIIAYSVGDTYTQSTLNTMFSPITTTGLVLISSTTIGSAVSSVVVSSAFSTTYENYKIIVSGGVMSGTSNIQMTLGSATSNYNNQINGADFGNTPSSIGATGAANFTRVGAGTVNFTSCNVDLFMPFLAKPTTLMGSLVTVGGGYTILAIQTDNTSFTGFTITPTSGTMTGGTIKVYGYK